MSKENKISIGIAILALVVAVGVAMFGGKTIIEKVGGTLNVSNFDEIAVNDASEKWEKLELTSGSDQAVFTNRESFTQFADFASITTSGTASSSYNLYLVATSTDSIPNSHDYVELSLSQTNHRVLFRNIDFATSTTATTTNSIMATKEGKSLGVVPIPSGHSLILYLQQGDLLRCATGQEAGKCENATSTARGFNVEALFRTHSTSTAR